MKKVVFAAVVASLLTGCIMNQPTHHHHKHEAEEATRSEVADSESGQVATSGVADRLHFVKLRGNDSGYFTVKINNGYTQAMVKDELARIKRNNDNYYSIMTKEYIIGIYLDENGFSSASWNRHKGRDHGDFVLIASSE